MPKKFPPECWVRQAEVDDGVLDGQTSAEASEPVQLRRKTRRLGTACSDSSRTTSRRPSRPV